MTDALSDRYSRNLGLFGSQGQSRLQATAVAVVGLGGLGCHVVQQLAYLGVVRQSLIDPDVVEPSNLNRLVGATPSDVGEPKIAVARRVLTAIQSAARVDCVQASVYDAKAEHAIVAATHIFGCLDNDAARLRLTELASRHRIPYFDLASDTHQFGGRIVFGGRVFV